jgi:hypothetical protein
VTARLVIGVAVASPLWAAGLETQHAFDFAAELKPGLELTIHSRIRTQPRALGFYQARAGPILSWDAAPRLAVLGGYYYSKQERSAGSDFIGGHRLFAGTEVELAAARRWSLDQRLLAERFFSGATADYNRYRLRTRLSAEGAVAPFTAHEFFFDAKGWRSNRHSAGVRWRALPAVQIELGYLYEHRRPDAGQDRHMVLISGQLKLPKRR